jgi:hypothetical protein
MEIDLTMAFDVSPQLMHVVLLDELNKKSSYRAPARPTLMLALVIGLAYRQRVSTNYCVRCTFLVVLRGQVNRSLARAIRQ